MADPGKIRIIVVDDSVVYRNMIHKVLSEDPDIEIVSQASNGKLAIPRIKHYRPDFVLLDQEMPEMTGLELLEYMRNEFPEVGVLMFSSKTVEGAKVTLKALELGALDFVTKPQFTEDGNIKEYIRETVVEKLKGLKGFRRPAKKVTGAKIDLPSATKAVRAVTGSCEVCAIGISTGGPQALRELIPLINKNVNGSVFIVQHMPAIFTAQLADSLNVISGLKVVEASNGMRVEKGVVYIAPGGKHMIVERKSDAVYTRLLEDPPELSCKPSVNYLFRSVAEAYGARAGAVVMTGMGSDGAAGMKVLSEKGAYCFCQDEKSSLIFGMPAIPVKEGTAMEVLDIQGIAKRIEYLLGVS